MQVKDLRVLVAGCGSIGLRHAGVLRDLGVVEMAACDPSEKSRQALAEQDSACRLYADYAEALTTENPDAVFLLTPTRLHIEMAKQAVMAGAHVFIEKPISNSNEGVAELKALARMKGKKVMVGFCFRYHDGLLKAKKAIEQGAIGRLVSIRALMGEPFYDIHPDYMNMYYSKYSGAFELVHDLDLAIWFAGQPIESVQSVYGSFSDMGMESPDTIEMLVKFADRCVANVHLDFFQTPRRRQIDLIGVMGVITVEFASWDKATISVFSRSDMQWHQETIATVRNDMFRAEDSEFFDCVLNNTPVRCTIDEALKSLEAIAAVYKPY